MERGRRKSKLERKSELGHPFIYKRGRRRFKNR